MTTSCIWSIDRILSRDTSQDKVGKGVMPMKGYSVFPKAAALLEPRYQIILSHNQDTGWVGGYLSAEMQLVYFTVLANRII